MHVAQQPAGIDITHDLLDRIEGESGVGRVVHGQHDAGDKLNYQHDRQDTTEGVGVVQVPRHRVGDETVMHKPCHRQACIHPLSESGGGLISRMIAAHGLKPP